MDICYVYALMERDKIYYIGKAKDPYKRYEQHLKGQSNDIVKSWINKLKSKNEQPTLKILEQCECHRVEERETALIKENASPALKNIHHNKWKDPQFIEEHWKRIHEADLRIINRQATALNEMVGVKGVSQLLTKIEKLEHQLEDYKQRYQKKTEYVDALLKQMKQYYK